MSGHLHNLMMRTALFLLVSLLQAVFLVLCSSAGSQIDSTQAKIQLKSSVDRSEVPFNRELILSVEASWEGEQNRFGISPLIPPQCENFEILGSSSVNQTRMEQGRSMSVKTFKFDLKPTQTGVGRIGSVQLRYVDNATRDSSSLSTPPIEVKITAPVAEKGAQYRTVLLICLLLILVYVIYSARRHRKRVEIDKEWEAEKQVEKDESPEEKALMQLGALAEQVGKGESGQFPSGIYKLLTGYLDAKYQMVTAGKTTNGIIDSLAKLELPAEKVGVIKEVLSACDLAKFAAERMDKSRCQEMVNKVREFLEQNQ